MVVNNPGQGPPGQKEPKVSVYGIPQSQFSSSQLPGAQPQPGGGGLIGNIKQHWAVWMVGIGVATIAVYLWVARSGGGSSTTPYNAATPTSADALWGSNIDADFQQLISSENTNQGILNQILNNTTPPTIPPSPPPTPVPTGTHELLSFNPEGTNYTWGQTLTIAGTKYLTGWGGSAPGVRGPLRLWGVPFQQGMTKTQWNAIAPSSGNKVLIWDRQAA